MRKEVNTSFSDIRKTSERMLRLVQRINCGEEPINFRTSMNDDLGFLGSDWDMFLEEYEKEFKTQLYGLNHSDYFYEEVLSLKDVLMLPIRLLWLVFIFLPARFLGIEKNKIFWYSELPPLTVGDLVLSAIAGEFVKREMVTINIKRHDA